MKINCCIEVVVNSFSEDIEVPDEELTDFTEEEINEYLQAVAEKWLWDSSGMEFWWKIIE